MADAAVTFLLEELRSAVSEHANLISGISVAVMKLNIDLRMVYCLLRDADLNRANGNSLIIQSSMKELKEIAFKAENVLEKYAAEVQSNREVKSFKKKIQRIMNTSIPMRIHQVAMEIKFISSSLAHLTANLRAGEGSSRSADQEQRRFLRLSYAHEVDQHFVGMEQEIGLLVSMVEKDSPSHISICGMGGLGKTALARKIYHHQDVEAHFDCRVWVCVTQQFQVETILKEILESIDVGNAREPDMELSLLVEELRRVLERRKCLIVIDDIWETDHWEKLKRAFPTKNCKVVLTTRNEKIVSQRGYVHKLRFLIEDEGWKLLKKIAFPTNDGVVPESTSESFEDIGKQVVQKCGGLPLAISVFGAILCQKPLKKWVEVCNNLRHGNDAGGQLDNMLNLSYDGLLYELKSCFLYLACFPKGQEIDTEQLYLLWNAERLLFWEVNENNGTLREVAENYLTELADRSMVQVEKSGIITPHKKFESCRLHGPMHDFCSAKAQEENFIKYVNISKHQQDIHITTGASTQRLVIHLDDDDDEDEEEEEEEVASSKISTDELKDLRSFLFLCKSRYNMRATNFQKIFDLESSKNLWILVLDGVIFENGILPSTIGKQRFLKYLSLHRSCVQELPKHVCYLPCLQTLDLRVWRTIKLPNFIWKMKSLQHLFLPSTIEVIGGGKLKLKGMDKLETLKGINSMSICIADVVELKKLQRLSAKIEDMDSLSKIVDFMSNIDECQLHETDLTIESCDLRNVFPKMVMIPSLVFLHIIQCKIGCSITPSDEQAMCPNLVKLTIVNSKIVGDLMKALGKFPILQYLSLHGEFIGELRGVVKAEMTFGVDSFPKLKLLMLINLMNLHKWEVEEGAMRELQELRIWQCRNLKKLPDGLRFIKTLQVLQCYGVSEELKGRMRQCYGSEDYAKFSHIPSIHIR